MKRRKDARPAWPWEKLAEWLALALGCAMLWVGSQESHAAGPAAKWTRFVAVEEQPAVAGSESLGSESLGSESMGSE